MPAEELLGLMLRDDKFLRMMTKDEEEIRQIWNDMVGKVDGAGFDEDHIDYNKN